MNEIRINIEKEKDPETLEIAKKIVISPNYYNLTISDRLELLDMLIEWSTKELENVKEISKRKISTKTRLIL